MSTTTAAVIRECRPDLTTYEAVYKNIHANPELSHCESETASLIIQHLRGLSADFEIRAGIGGHGLIAILQNGTGKTVLLRADIDALPVTERTGLEYASLRRQIGNDGKEMPVMHGREHFISVQTKEEVTDDSFQLAVMIFMLSAYLSQRRLS